MSEFAVFSNGLFWDSQGRSGGGCLERLLKPREIAYHLQDSDAKAFICFEGTAELPMGQMGKAGFDAAPECRP